MNKNIVITNPELRRRAEERLAAANPGVAPQVQPSGVDSVPVGLSKKESQRLIHELQVHQIELEMQNEALHQSRAEVEVGLSKYTDLYDFAPTGYLVLSPDGVIKQANLTSERMLGLLRSDMIGRRLGLFVAVADRVTFSTCLQVIFASGEKQVCEAALAHDVALRHDSGCLFVQMEGSVSADGHECRLSMSDITARRQSDEALRVSQAGLRRSEQRLMTLHELDRAIQHSQTVEQIADMALGYMQSLIPFSTAALIEFDESSGLWTALASRTDMPAISRHMTVVDLPSSMTTLLEHRDYFVVNDLVLTPGMSTLGKDLLTYGLRSHLVVPLRDQSALIGYLYVGAATPDFITAEYIDIAREMSASLVVAIQQARWSSHLLAYANELEERVAARTLDLQATLDALREQEAQKRLVDERLHLQFYLAPDPTIMLDRALVLRDVNLAYETVFGYKRAELIGHTPHELGIISDEEFERVRYVRELLEQGQLVPPYELVMQSKAGNPIEFEINIHAETIGGERMYLSSMHDISQRKRAEVVLRESNRKLVELIELKSRFVSMASHGFRTPLATIMFTADVLRAQRNKMDDAKISNWLQQIVIESQHMQEMIDEVLQLSHRQASGYTLKPAVIDLDAECSELVERFEATSGRDHKLVYTSNVQPIYALVDAKQMKEVVTNLISNALKYSPVGTTIGIDLTASVSQIILRVSDQGIGIPAKNLPNLFEPFFRADNVGQVAGTGLGLSITKNAVELHGGTITVESEVGKGTTLIVTLPTSA